ncbi:4-alpha-glucanotransferase [Enemella dayhoffiae]|uniref:4-alpha-glucanotransferase n=1 Tax=Enemella dayhoffiae TaxID=2016507 RepID=UPI001BB1B7C7|nr:4-alpha-glucanotransferase [Enemella dayhoffiae]
MDPALVELATALGVATEFVDWKGRRTVVSAETLSAVLGALEVDIDDPRTALAEHRLGPWRRMLPACVVVAAGERREFAVHVPAGDPVEVEIELEVGGTRSVSQVDNWEPAREVDGRLVGEASFLVPSDLPLGYHQIVARSGSERAEGALIVTPEHLGFPAQLGNRRTWGLATQLYSVRSGGSWGIGDLSDLTDLAVWSAAEHRAGYVLVNPMHAAEPQVPMEPSPYLPTSRRFFNPIYLRVEAIDEYAELTPAQRMRVRAQFEQLSERLAGVDAIDRNQVWLAKEPALRAVFEAGLRPGRAYAFAGFCAREGQGLLDFATWCALSRALGADWRTWAVEYQSPQTEAVQRFRDENAEEIDFHRWLQWCLDEQFREAQGAATSAGMELGIVHDLAVGVSPAGSDAWSLGSVFARSVSVGAPPDQFTQLGQDWGQPPLRPDRLADTAYRPFRDMLGSILRHSGGIRVDHIIGLFRLWWVPTGMPATRGTYVRYDHEAMIGILALEAHRAGALVVGEDLGTVEPWVRDYLLRRGILGTSILWFEQDWTVPGGRPLPPEEWREYCLASVTTHDLPPTTGYLAGDHVRLRHRLGLLTDGLEEELARDRSERDEWLAVLREHGVLAEGVDVDTEEGSAEVVRALHRFLVRTRSRMLNLALTDAVGDRRTQNQPGTSNEYPNWRVPLTGPNGEPMTLEQVFTSDRAAAACHLLAEGL